jgi:hypothetical protein
VCGAEEKKSILVGGMVRIESRDRKRIRERCGRFLE